MESSKDLSAPITSSRRSRELKIATLRREEIKRQHEAKLHLEQKKILLELEEMAKQNQVKLAGATLRENAILEHMKGKISSLDLPEESLDGSKRTSWMNKTTKNSVCTKTEPIPSAAGFKSFRFIPVNPFFQPAIFVSTRRLDEYNTYIRNPFHSKSVSYLEVLLRFWRKN